MNTATSPRKLEVQLTADHPSLGSTELTRLLVLRPDEHWDVGQLYRPTRSSPEQRYQFSRWAIKAVADSLDELTHAIQALTSRIRGMEKNFLLLPSNSTISLTLFVTETDTVFGMGLDAEVIKLLARINAGVEVSLVVTEP